MKIQEYGWSVILTGKEINQITQQKFVKINERFIDYIDFILMIEYKIHGELLFGWIKRLNDAYLIVNDEFKLYITEQMTFSDIWNFMIDNQNLLTPKDYHGSISAQNTFQKINEIGKIRVAFV